MADLWRPVKGVAIKEARQGLFLFSFAHPLDMEGVLNGGPWTFDNNTLIMERVQIGMQIENIPLFHAAFWVQIHNLPTGLMKESVGKDLANYIGMFMEYDKNNNSNFWRQYMRVRVKVDVRQPLKKDTKVKNKAGEWCTINFKYEKLGVFCFVCGIMGHAENKCEVRYSMENDDGNRKWSGEIRADQRKQGGRQTSRWLREERGGGEGFTGGARRINGDATMGGSSMGTHSADVYNTSQIQPHHHHPTMANTLNANQENSIICLGQPFNHMEPRLYTTCSQPIFQTKTDTQIESQNQPLLLTETEKLTPLKADQTTLKTTNVLSPNYGQSSHNHDQQLLQFPFPNNQINTPLFLNNSPIFTSKSKLPIKLNDTRKNPSVHRTQLVHNKTRPVTKKNHTQPEPNQNEPILSLNRTEPETQLNQVSAADMEIQMEKKRRREEDNKSEENGKEIVQHFLSAGPGSQDCREQ
jgi:14-3-3 protein epsilon